jgi:hypothetical protein
MACYLIHNGLSIHQIYCGYDVKKQEWQVYYLIMVEGLTDEMRKEVSAETIGRFLNSNTETNILLGRPTEIPFEL